MHFSSSSTSRCLVLSLTLFASSAGAQERPPAPQSPADAVEVGSDPSVMPRPPHTDVPVWKQALTHYSLGETDEALTLLSESVHDCAEREGACTDPELGTLYACVAIVQAGGKKAHGPAVIAFRKALSLDAGIVVLSEYRTAEVDAAFQEAKTGKSASSQSNQDPKGTSAAAEKTEEQLEEERKHESDLLKQRAFLLLTAYGQMGNVQTYTYATDDPNFEMEGLGRVGGAVTLAGMPGETSGFTMGGRFRAGAYLTDNGGLGHYGISGLLGGTTGKRRDNQFAYFLGGIGMDHYPALDSTAVDLSFQGGASMGGLVLGGVADLVIGAEIAAFMLGLEIGFGPMIGK